MRRALKAISRAANDIINLIFIGLKVCILKYFGVYNVFTHFQFYVKFNFRFQRPDDLVFDVLLQFRVSSPQKKRLWSKFHRK